MQKTTSHNKKQQSLRGNNMNISWKDIFIFAKQALGSSQSQIADCLGLNRSTISLLVSGKKLRLKYPFYELYEKLFNPENKESLVFNWRKTNLLEEFIEYYDGQGFAEEIEPLTKGFAQKTIKDSDYEPFVMGLLRIVKGNEPPKNKEKLENRKGNTKPIGTEADIMVVSQLETPPEQMRDRFIAITNDYKIMEILERKQPIFNRDDSARFSVSSREIGALISKNKKHNEQTLYTKIKQFRDALRFYALTIEANLNAAPNSDDESAFINLEDEIDDKEELAVRLGIPRLSNELISSADDIFEMMELAIRKWSTFRCEMNILYEEIHKWSPS